MISDLLFFAGERKDKEKTMDLQFGDIQETALITLAILASETSRPNARIRDPKAKEIIDALSVDVSKFDPFLSHEGVVARTIIFREELKRLLKKYPDAVCINLGCGFDDKFSQVDNGRLTWFDVDLPDSMTSSLRWIMEGLPGLTWICRIRSPSAGRCLRTVTAAQ